MVFGVRAIPYELQWCVGDIANTDEGGQYKRCSGSNVEIGWQPPAGSVLPAVSA